MQYLRENSYYESYGVASSGLGFKKKNLLTHIVFSDSAPSGARTGTSAGTSGAKMAERISSFDIRHANKPNPLLFPKKKFLDYFRCWEPVYRTYRRARDAIQDLFKE